MAFQIFTQPQGANVSISLFGDATSAGINAGNALPTPTTAAIRGVQQGVALGLDTAAAIQNLQIKQNAIDNLPITNQLQIAQAENAQTIAEINALKLEQQKDLQTLSLKNTRKKLETENVKLDREKNLSEQRDLYAQEFDKANPVAQLNMVMSGRYNEIYSYDKGLYETHLQSIELNPNNGASAQTRAGLNSIRRKTGVQNDYLKNKAAYEKEANEAWNELKAQPFFGSLQQKTGLSPFAIANNIEFVKKDSKIIDNDTKAVINNPNFVDSTDHKDYDIILTHPVTRKKSIISTGRSQKEADLFNSFIAKKLDADGSSMRSDMALIDNQGKANQPSNTRFTPSASGGFEPSASSSSLSFVQQTAKSTLGVSDSTLSKITPTLTRFYNSIEQQELDPGNREVNALLFRDTVVQGIARQVAYSQYDEDPAIQSQYTQKDVDSYNEQFMAKLRLTRSSALYTDEELISEFSDEFVDSPQDLYFKTKKDILTSQVQTLANKFIETARNSPKNVYNWQSDKSNIIQGLIGKANARR